MYVDFVPASCLAGLSYLALITRYTWTADIRIPQYCKIICPRESFGEIVFRLTKTLSRNKFSPLSLTNHRYFDGHRLEQSNTSNMDYISERNGSDIFRHQAIPAGSIETGFHDGSFLAFKGLKCSSSSLISASSSDVEPDETMATVSSMASKSVKHAWKKPDDKPKRGLSAYNLFFQLERERLVAGDRVRVYDAADVERIAILSHKKAQIKRRHRKSHGKISFADLARTIANAWKKLEPSEKIVFEEYAAVENARYRRELERWMSRQKEERRQAGASSAGAKASVAILTPSFDVAQIVSTANNQAPALVTSIMAIVPATKELPTALLSSDCAKKIQYQEQPSGLEAILNHGDFLLQHPNQVSPEVLKEQIRLLEQEYMRQTLMLQSHAAASAPSSDFVHAPSYQGDSESHASKMHSAQPIMSMIDDLFGNPTFHQEDDPFEPRPIRTSHAKYNTAIAESVVDPMQMTAEQTRDWDEEDHLMSILLESYART
jgi:HMG (high mobility group) box